MSCLALCTLDVSVSQSLMIGRDLHMYHEETDTPALARTSNLNEDLGMVRGKGRGEGTGWMLEGALAIGEVMDGGHRHPSTGSHLQPE